MYKFVVFNSLLYPCARFSSYEKALAYAESKVAIGKWLPSSYSIVKEEI